jgi:hypothetical protein
MQPIGLTVKVGRNKYTSGTKGELMLIHRCNDCSKVSINRIAADDQTEMVAGVYKASLALDDSTANHLILSQIHLLQAKDESIVLLQLYGCYCQS